MGSFKVSSAMLISCAILLFVSGTTADLVPVYMWETNKANEVVPAIGHTSTDTFKDILQQKIQKNDPHIVVFVEESMSPEDYGKQSSKVFKHISKIASKAQVTYLPLVEDPLYAIKNLNTNVKEFSLEQVLKDVPNSKVTIVNLNDARDDEDRIDMLTRHDAAIIEIYNNILKDNKNVLAIYTGVHSSWITPEDIVNTKKRSILADEETPLVLKGDNVLLHLTSAAYTVDSELKQTEINVIGVKFTNSTEADGAKIELTTDDDIITLMYKSAMGYWYITNVGYKTLNVKTNIYAANKFSYSCNSSFFTKDKDETAIVGLVLPGMQIQVDTNKEIKAFNDAYHCVGFTSIPIWSGLFVSFILILILTLGLTMMMDIKTMDRFDDPKGKTIIVNAGE